MTPDPLDPRDYIFERDPGDLLTNTKLPYSVDLRNFVSREAESQGHVGSCAAAAAIHACELFDEREELSILFNYFTGIEQGRGLRGMLRAAQKYGLCLESDWPNVQEFENIQPPPEAYEAATQRRIGKYYRIRTEINQPDEDILGNIRYALAKGLPVLVSANVGSLVYSPTGVYPQLSTPGNQYIGGHAFLVVGYEKDGNFLCKNSWGPEWGDNGYFLCAPEVLTTDVYDCWVIRWFNGCSTVGPNQIVYPEKPAMITGEGQELIDQAIFYRLTAFEVEQMFGWPAGTVHAFSSEHPEFNWQGMEF